MRGANGDSEDEPMLMTRILTAVVLGPIVIAAAIVGEPWLSMLVGLVLVLAMVELVGLLEAAGLQPSRPLAVASGILVGAAGIAVANDAVVGGAVADLLEATTAPGVIALALALTWVVLGISASSCPRWRSSGISVRRTGPRRRRSARSNFDPGLRGC